MKNQRTIDRLTAIASKTTDDIFVTLDRKTQGWNIRRSEHLHDPNLEFSVPIDRDDLKNSITKIVNTLEKEIVSIEPD
jgi:hypothetical protein